MLLGLLLGIPVGFVAGVFASLVIVGLLPVEQESQLAAASAAHWLAAEDAR